MNDHIMLDLETMSTTSNAAIIELSAAKFNETGIVSTFSRIVDLNSSLSLGLDMSLDTVLWWSKQSDDANDIFSKDSISIDKALDDFSIWYGDGDIPMWGNGSDFDNVILANAYTKSNKDIPWNHRMNRCYRTFKSQFQNIELQRVGTHHNAKDDAISQALHLIEIAKSASIVLN